MTHFLNAGLLTDIYMSVFKVCWVSFSLDNPSGVAPVSPVFGLSTLMESLILAQDERWRRA